MRLSDRRWRITGQYNGRDSFPWRFRSLVLWLGGRELIVVFYAKSDTARLQEIGRSGSYGESF